MKIEDRLNLVFAVPFGLLLGVLGVALLQSYSVLGGWFVLIVVGGAVLLFAVNALFDALGDKLFSIGVKKAGRGDAPAEKAPKSSLPRKVFLASVLAGAGLSAIWDPIEILKLLPDMPG